MSENHNVLSGLWNFCWPVRIWFSHFLPQADEGKIRLPTPGSWRFVVSNSREYNLVWGGRELPQDQLSRAAILSRKTYICSPEIIVIPELQTPLGGWQVVCNVVLSYCPGGGGVKESRSVCALQNYLSSYLYICRFLCKENQAAYSIVLNLSSSIFSSQKQPWGVV